MIRQFDTGVAVVTVLSAFCLCLALAGGAAAVSGGEVTSLTNAEVEAGQSATHTLTYEADGFSADGATDTVYVQFPDVYAGNLSFSTVEFVNRTSGATVSVSSSTSVVDGPDGDGVKETFRTGISNDADYSTDAVNATYEFGLSHPPVAETTSYDVTVVATDSATERHEATASDAITVVAGEGTGTSQSATGTQMETSTEMDSDSDSSMDSDAGGSTEMDSDSDSDSDAGGSTEMDSAGDEGSGDAGTTATSTPGFGAVVALVALVAAALVARRRD